jgi:alpha-tubulin suppressor-like RCC1 family protein
MHTGKDIVVGSYHCDALRPSEILLLFGVDLFGYLREINNASEGIFA